MLERTAGRTSDDTLAVCHRGRSVVAAGKTVNPEDLNIEFRTRNVEIRSHNHQQNQWLGFYTVPGVRRWLNVEPDRTPAAFEIPCSKFCGSSIASRVAMPLAALQNGRFLPQVSSLQVHLPNSTFLS